MKQTIVWTKPGCPSCVQAKSFLMSKNIPFQERVIGTEWTREQLFDQLPNARSVPQIFMYGEYVGGWNELQQYADDHGMFNGGDSLT